MDFQELDRYLFLARGTMNAKSAQGSGLFLYLFAKKCLDKKHGKGSRCPKIRWTKPIPGPISAVS